MPIAVSVRSLKKTLGEEKRNMKGDSNSVTEYTNTNLKRESFTRVESAGVVGSSEREEGPRAKTTNYTKDPLSDQMMTIYNGEGNKEKQNGSNESRSNISQAVSSPRVKNVSLVSAEKEVSLYIFKEMEGERAVTW